jgi:hypothetical protein
MRRAAKRLLPCLFLTIAAFITCEKKEEIPAALFTKGVYPLVFQPADFPPHPKTGAAMRSSADCAPCHKTVYDNWRESRHRVALTNELYHESHAREPSPWCVNCHAPLREAGSEKTAYRGEEGISCLVCHARAGKILTGSMPAKADAHSYTARPEFKDERLCEGCHDFNFPTAASAMSEGKDFHYTSQPMQSTVEEYRASAYYGRVTCQGCHLLSGTRDSHRFPGGHALERLKNDLKLEIERIDAAHILVRLSAHGIGHAFPTGDLFRTVRVRLIDNTSRHTAELELRHHFEMIPVTQRRGDDPVKRRTKEETLPTPRLDYVSQREYTISWPNTSASLTAELYMDYLAQANTFTTQLPAHITRPLVFRKKFPLQKRPADDAKG